MTYNIVMIKDDKSIISRPAGNDPIEAANKAAEWREDFPQAKEIRIIDSERNILVIM